MNTTSYMYVISAVVACHIHASMKPCHDAKSGIKCQNPIWIIRPPSYSTKMPLK